MKRLNLKCFRIMKKITQKEMAERLCISRQMYYNIESGKVDPSYNVMQKFSEVFKNEYDDIFELFKKQ